MLNEFLVKNHPFIKSAADKYFTGELIKILIPRTYSPNEVVVFRHSPCPCMFFIRFGKINILATDDASTVTSLLTGEHFGCFEFLFDVLFEHTHKTGTFTELLVLDRQRFDALLNNPGFKDIQSHLKATVDDLSRFINQSLLGVGAAKYTSTKKKANSPAKTLTRKTTQPIFDLASTNIEEDDSDVFDFDPSCVSPSLTPTPNARPLDNPNSPNSSSTSTPSSPSRNSLLRNKLVLNLSLRDSTDVFPHRLIRRLASDVALLNNKVASTHPDEPTTASSTDLDSTISGHHKGVVYVLLQWWQHRNSVNEQIAIFAKNMKNKKKFAEMMDNEDEEDMVLMPDYFVILEDSKVRQCWDLLYTILLAYYCILIPRRIYKAVTISSVSLFSSYWSTELIADYVIDFFFLVDIFMNARIFALTEVNELGKTMHITERDQIVTEYWRGGRMTNDILIFLPYDILGFMMGGGFFLCRLPKLALALRFPRMVHQLKQHLNHHKIHLSVDGILVLNLIFFTMIFTHWSSTIWVILNREKTAEVEVDGSMYVKSMYWSLTTITTVGFGDNTADSEDSRWFSIFMMIIGSCFTAGVIANITSMAHKVVVSEDNAQHVTTCVEKYMVEKGLPHDIRDRCLRYFHMLKNDINEEKILKELLPPPFLPDIAVHVYSNMISRTPLFSSCKLSGGLSRSIALLLKEEVVVEHDWVVKDNPAHLKWYQIKQGKIHILDLVRNELIGKCSLDDHLSFGDEFLFADDLAEAQQFNAKAVTNCVLVTLEPADFRSLQSNYEKEYRSMRSFVLELAPDDDGWPSEGSNERTSRRSTRKRRKTMTQTHFKAKGGDPSLASLISDISHLVPADNHHHPIKKLLKGLKGEMVFAPNSLFQLVWNMVLLFFIFVNVFMMPFNAAFRGHKTSLQLICILDYLGDFVFILDSRLRSTCFAYLEGDTIINEKEAIAANYKKFKLKDMISLVPLEILCPIPIAPLSIAQRYGFLRLLRLLRASHHVEITRCFDLIMFTMRGVHAKNELKVIKLLALIVISGHWLGCVWFFIAFLEESDGLPSWADCRSSIPTNHLFGCMDGSIGTDFNSSSLPYETTGDWKPTIDQYVRSVYWATTSLTTAGYGDVSASTKIEEIFSILVLIVGTLIFATVISNLEEIVAQVDVTSTLFQQGVDDVKAFMKMRSISPEVQEEIGRYHDTLWLKQKGATDMSVLGYLPKRVRHEVLKFHVMKCLKFAPVFKKCSLPFLNSVLDVLQSDFFLQEQTVWEKGECGFELYFITRGSVDLMDGKTKLLTVGNGAILGEGEFFNRTPRVCDALTSEYTTTFYLTFDCLQLLLDADPDGDATFKFETVNSAASFDTNAKVMKMKENMKSGGKMATMLMLDDEVGEKKDLVFLPDNFYRRLWDMWLLFIMLANLILVPFRIAYYDEAENDPATEVVWFAVNLFLDIFMWVNIGLNFRYFAVVYEGLLIADKNEFYELYKETRFGYDLIASLPIDSICWLAGVRNIRTVSLIRLPRVINAKRLAPHIQSTIDFCEEQGVRAQAGLWHLMRMVIAVLLCVHWSACSVYYIAVLEGLTDDNSWTSTTALSDSAVPKLDKYTTSVYWSMYTVTLVGYGDILLKSNVEMAFAILIMLLGTILCEAGIAAILTSIVNALDASSGEAHAWSQVITKYMRHRSLPVELQDRIFSFFVHMHLSEYDLDEVKVLKVQPRFIKHKLLMDVCFDAVRTQFKPLHDFSDGFVSSVVQGMYPYLALPKEILISVGMPFDKIFLVVRGKVHEMTASRNKYLVVNTLEHGKIVGDFTEPEVTFRAFAYCELYCLPLDHFSKCFVYATNNSAPAMKDGGKKKGIGKSMSHSSGLLKRSGTSIEMLSGRAAAHMKRHTKAFAEALPIVDLNDPFRKVWNFLCLFFTCYMAVFVPIETFIFPGYAFYSDTDDVPLTVLNSFDLFVDIFFVVDLVLCMTVFNDWGLTFESGSEDSIFWCYADHPAFWYDIVATFPFDHLAGVGTADVGTQRLIKLVRVLRLPYYLQGFLDVLEEIRFLTHIGLQRMWNLFFISTVAGHWAATIFLHVSMEEVKKRSIDIAANGTSAIPATWIENDGLVAFNSTTNSMQNLNSVYEMYARSLYWAYVTMITTGFGDITPNTTYETVACITSMYVGVMITCAAIANLTLLVSNFDQAANDFHQKLDNVNKFLTYQQVPGELSNKIRQYYEYQWTVLKGVDEARFMEELTPQLQQTFQAELIRDYLMNIDVLRRASPSLIAAMIHVDAMDKIMLSPQDVLIEKGNMCKGLYILTQGVAQVMKGKSKDIVESDMRKGETTFGVMLLEENPTPSTIMAKSYCEFLYMPKDRFLPMADLHCVPEDIEAMKRTGAKSMENAEKLKKFLGGQEDNTVSGWRTLFLPGQPGRKRWDLAATLVNFFYGVEIPLHIAKTHAEFNVILLALSIFFDIFFAINIVMHSRFFPFRDTKTGLIIMDVTDIHNENARKSTRVGRALKYLSCVPFEILVLVGVLPSDPWLAIFRILKLGRLKDLPGNIAELEEDFSEEIKTWDTSTRRFIKLNLGMIGVCYFTGCVWYWIGTFTEEILGDEENWINVDQSGGYLSHDDLWFGCGWFVRSFYFALVGMSTVGYGDIVPHSIAETIVSSVIILVGGLVLPAVVGGLASMMGNMNAGLAQFRRKMDNLDGYMREHEFPRVLQERVKNYYNYLWTRLGGVSNREQELSDLPTALKDSLSVCIKGPILSQVPFLEGAHDEVLKSIRAVLRPQIFLPGDIIIRAGVFGQEMYLIERGKILVMSEDQSVTFAVLERGDYFGESSLLQGEKRVATVVSPGYCDCLVLTKENFDDCLKDHPGESENLRVKIGKVLEKKKKVDVAVERNLEMYNKLDTTASKEQQDIKVTGLDIDRWHPDSHFRQWWGLVLLVVLIVYMFKIPFQIAFAFSISWKYFIVEYVLDLVFIADMWMCWNRFSFTTEGRLVTDPAEITVHYRNGTFARDLMSTFPWDILAFLGGVELQAWLRLFKLIRLVNLKEYSTAVEKVMSSFGLRRGNGGVKLGKLGVVVMFISHLAGCFFFFMAEKNSLHDRDTCVGLDNVDKVEWATALQECKWEGTWMQLQMADDKVDFDGGSTPEYYLRSLNWALPTLVVVVIGDVIPLTSAETVYCLMWMLVGVTINASIVGNIASIVANLETESSLFIKRADTLQDYLFQHGLPPAIQDRSRKYLDWLWTQRRGRNQDTILHELPFTLRQEVSNLSRVKYVQSCEFFSDLPMLLVEAIAMSFRSHLYSVHDQIVSVGDESFELFFVEKGSVEVVLSDGKTVCAKIDSGNFFGESALFAAGHRMANIRAADFCELLSLHRVDFGQIFKNHESERAKVLETFQTMQSRNETRNKGVEEELKRKMSLMMHVSHHDSKGYMDWGVSRQSVWTTVLWKIEEKCMQHAKSRVTWEFTGLFFLLYLIIKTPLHLGFFFDNMWDGMEIDYLIDVYFLFDIVLRSLFFNNDVANDGEGAEGEGGKKKSVKVNFEQVKSNGVKTIFSCEILSRTKYRHGWIFVDILASTPFDLIAWYTWGGTKGLHAASWLRLVHVIRGYRLFEYIQAVESYLYHIRIRISADVFQLFKVILCYLLVNHFFACFWMGIHRYAERDVEATWATNDGLAKWDEEKGEHDVCTDQAVMRCYIRAFHLVITTISSVGYGDIYPATELETMFELIVVVSGATLVACLIGSFAALFQGQDSSGGSAFKAKLNTIQEYMLYKGLDKELTNKILKHHRHLYSQQKTLDVNTVMQDLPRPLQMEIAMFINRKIIHKVPLLRDCSVTIQKNVALALKPQFVEFSSFVYEAGDIGNDVFFILKGNIMLHKGRDVSKLDRLARGRGRRESVQNILKDGNTFGEDVVVSKTGVRCENARAVSNSHMFTLSKGEIEGVLSMLGPEARVVFLEILLKRDLLSLDDEEVDDEESEEEDDDDEGGGSSERASGGNAFSDFDKMNLSASGVNGGGGKKRGPSLLAQTISQSRKSLLGGGGDAGGRKGKGASSMRIVPIGEGEAEMGSNMHEPGAKGVFTPMAKDDPNRKIVKVEKERSPKAKERRLSVLQQIQRDRKTIVATHLHQKEKADAADANGKPKLQQFQIGSYASELNLLSGVKPAKVERKGKVYITDQDGNVTEETDTVGSMRKVDEGSPKQEGFRYFRASMRK